MLLRIASAGINDVVWLGGNTGMLHPFVAPDFFPHNDVAVFWLVLRELLVRIQGVRWITYKFSPISNWVSHILYQALV